MSGIKGGPKTHTTTQRTQVTMPDWLGSAFQGAAGAARDLYASGGPQYFPNSTAVPYSAPTLSGLTTMEGLAADPGQIPGYGSSFQALEDTLSGEYLYGGEGFNAALDAASRAITPRVKSAFNRSGRTGGGLAQAAMAEELGDVFAGMYGQERGRQQQAIGMAPQMYDLALAPARTMMGVGQALESKQGQELADQVARWNYQQQQPTSLLDTYLRQIAPIGGMYAGRETSGQQPIYSSGGSGLLGAALGLGSMFLPGGGALSGFAPAFSGPGYALNVADTMGAFNTSPARLFG